MKKLLPIYFLAGCMALFAACSDDDINEKPGDTPSTPGDDEQVDPEPDPDPSGSLTGYGDPDGMMILSSGSGSEENAYLTFIAPDGTVENHVYANANGGATLGNAGVDMYLCGNKQYILCNDYFRNTGQLLIIADAETLKKEKSFARESMVFEHPINMVDDKKEMEEVDESLKGIIALDEQNIFIFGQGVLRFDSTTGKLTLVKDGYDIGNAGSANTVESITAAASSVVANGNIYSATGGFWQSGTLLEFVKGKDEVNRKLTLRGRGDLVSGVCQIDDHTIVVGSYLRGKANKEGYLCFVDINKWDVTDSRTIDASIARCMKDNSGITYHNGYLYFTGGVEGGFSADLNTTLSRYHLESGKLEKDIVDFKADAPEGNVLDCCVTADPDSGYLYVALSDQWMEGYVPQSTVLVYDLNGETPKLVKKISNEVHYVAGFYPL